MTEFSRQVLVTYQNLLIEARSFLADKAVKVRTVQMPRRG